MMIDPMDKLRKEVYDAMETLIAKYTEKNEDMLAEPFPSSYDEEQPDYDGPVSDVSEWVEAVPSNTFRKRHMETVPKTEIINSGFSAGAARCLYDEAGGNPIMTMGVVCVCPKCAVLTNAT
jgi:hypothetical protein